MRPGAGPAARAYEERTGIKAPHIIAWEITRRCNLVCAHCRASALCEAYPGELSLEQCKAVIDDIASITDPILILTGGEPLMRPDIWEIIDYANLRGMHPVVGTNGTLIDDEVAAQLAAHGIPRISVSLDFPDPAGQDAFRGRAGAFDQTVEGIRHAREHGVEVQVNTTVTKLNHDKLDTLHDLSQELGAVAFHPFLLVPTGRGENLIDVELTPQEYEEVMHWAYRRQQDSPMHFKPTDAPMYYRVIRQDAAAEGRKVSPETYGMEAMTRGCLGGITFCFISHTGDIQPCGYFDMQLGNVLEKPFSEIWTTSPVFDDLRHYDRLKGKCGACEFKGVCGGCRARALSLTGDYMQEEPYCAYEPKTWARDKVLDRIQSDFPLEADPVKALARDLNISEQSVHDALLAIKKQGLVRRIGGSFAANGLGYVSTLCALSVPEERLDEVAAIVSEYPGVTHNYARQHHYNLWFTLIAAGEQERDRIIDEIRARTGVKTILNLPATRLYKIQVDFSNLDDAKGAADDFATGNGNGSDSTAASDNMADDDASDLVIGGTVADDAARNAPAPFDPANPFDVELIRWAQGDVLYRNVAADSSADEHGALAELEIEDRPYAHGARLIGQRLGHPVSEDEVLCRLGQLKELGAMRRIGAIVRHQKMGMAFNAMTAWDVPDALADTAGAALAENPHVSHCYARPRQADWNSNIFAMVHARTKSELEQTLSSLRASLCAAGIHAVEPQVLTSAKEYKKTSMRYFM